MEGCVNYVGLGVLWHPSAECFRNQIDFSCTRFGIVVVCERCDASWPVFCGMFCGNEGISRSGRWGCEGEQALGMEVLLRDIAESRGLVLG